jgi:hypothetical protein
MRTHVSRRLRAGVTLLGALVMASHLLGRANESPWDDAYFFKRISRNFLEHGAFAWNVSEGPVYGNTSFGFQLLSAALTFLAPDHYFAWLRLVAAGLELVLLNIYLSAVAAPAPADAPAAAPGAPPGDAAAAPRASPDVVAAVALAFVAWATPMAMRLLVSGMDFHLGFVVLALALVEARRHEPTWRGALRFGALSVATYAVRPDAVMLPLVALTARELAGARRLPWRALAAAAAGLGATWALAYAYFGTPVPLSFYLKSHGFSNYGPEFIAACLPDKHRNAFTVALFALPLAYVASHRRRAATAAALLASSAFFAFHFFSTVEIMSYQARFYLPGLVPLVFAAIEAVPDFRRKSRPAANVAFSAAYAALAFGLVYKDLAWTSSSVLPWLGRLSPWLYAGQAAAVALWAACAPAPGRRALVATAAPLVAGTIAAGPPPKFAFPSDGDLVERYLERFTPTRGIRAVQDCLPEPLHIYHSEIGVPGVLFPRSTITDFAGLMHKDVALHGFDVDGRCSADRPEVIFMPHKVYIPLRRRVEESACARNYTRMVDDSSSPLYVRNDLAEGFRRCANETGDPWVSPPPAP